VAAGAVGRLTLLHGSYLQDWLHSPRDDNWRVEPELGGASRAFADIGSHWCDLVEFVSGHRIAALTAQVHTAVPERDRVEARQAFASGGAGDGRRSVSTEDIATVMFRTDAGAVGSVVISQVSAGRKNRLWLELDGAEGSLAFDQEQPETLWLGSRDGAHVLPRDPGGLSAAAAPYAVVPAGHPQGYLDCFEAFVAESYAAFGGGPAADGLPTLGDGLRAARITEAVLASARGGDWTEVAA
jgi:predicted dehydrogenase